MTYALIPIVVATVLNMWLSYRHIVATGIYPWSYMVIDLILVAMWLFIFTRRQA